MIHMVLKRKPFNGGGHHAHQNSPPLSYVDWLADPRYLIDKRYSARDVVNAGDVPYLFPWHGHVLQQLHHGMGHVLEGPVNKNEAIN